MKFKIGDKVRPIDKNDWNNCHEPEGCIVVAIAPGNLTDLPVAIHIEPVTGGFVAEYKEEDLEYV